jgi:hypothetical protein
MADYIGGEPGRNGERVIEDKDLTKNLPASSPWIDLADFPNTALLRCKLPRIRGNLELGTRLLDCAQEGVVAEDLHDQFGSHLIYANGGKGGQNLGVVIQGLKQINCRAQDGIEIKGVGVTIADCEQINCKNEAGTGPMPESVRLRHGGKHVVIRNKFPGVIKVRGYLIWVVANVDSKVLLWAGDANARLTEGGKMPSSELCYVEKCASVVVGHVFGNQKQFPAKNNIIDPGMPDDRIKLGAHTGTERRRLSSIDKLQAMVGP